jgi:hypothetical protein
MSIFKDKQLDFFGKSITIKWYKNIWWKVLRFIKSIWRTRFGCRTIQHWYQRARYGYSYRDVWSVVDWFRNILPKILSDLEESYMYRRGIHFLSEDSDDLTEDELLSMKFSLTERVIGAIESHEKWEDFMCMDEEERYKLREKYIDGMQIFAEYLGMFWD